MSPLSRSDALLELLHDAEEGLLGFDCISPLKDVLGLSFRAVSSRLMAAISARYELRAWTPAAHTLHKQADSVAAASEAVHCIGWPIHEVRDVLGIVHPVLDVDPLARDLRLPTVGAVASGCCGRAIPGRIGIVEGC
jgi:hypothetical protein